MVRSRQQAGNIFTGGMDKDSAVETIQPGNYIDAVDILNGYGGEITAINFYRGNRQIAHTLPSGVNVCVGAKEDKQLESLVFFVWNSNQQHLILRHFINASVNQTVVLAQGALLAFSGFPFKSIEIVDGKLLYWTEGRITNADSSRITGNEPRELDMEKAQIVGKNLKYLIYAGAPGDGQFASGNSYGFGLSQNYEGGTVEVFVEFVATGVHLNDPIGGLKWLKEQLEASDLNQYIFVETCGCKLEIEVRANFYIGPGGSLGWNYLAVDFSAGNDLRLVADNFYPPLQREFISLVKEPAHCAPVVEYISDNTTSFNNVKTLCAQFRVRYIFHTGAVSAWSPISNTALNISYSGEVIDALNAIRVDFSDPRLQNKEWLFMIRAVEVAFRDGNTDTFKLIDRYDLCDLSLNQQSIIFKNDRLYSPVPSDDSGPENIQVLKNFDHVPLISAGLATAADQNGNNLIFLGANLEGYDQPECLDMTLEAVAVSENEECLIDIVGRVIIGNRQADASFVVADEPDYEYYPLNGFVVYLAGTDYYGISDNPPDGTGTGIFRINSVPRGKYILRVASYKCGYDNEKGPRYNIANGLEYQRTSAPIHSMLGEYVNLVKFEAIIDLEGFVGTTFDLAAQFPSGNIEIWNQQWSRRPGLGFGSETIWLAEFYVMDNEGELDTLDKRIAALNVERQLVKVEDVGGTFVVMTKYTDHNGYTFLIVKNPPTSTLVMRVNTVTVFWYNGDWLGIYNDTNMIATTIQLSGADGTELHTYIHFNPFAPFTARKRELQFSATDVNNLPLGDVQFSLTRTTRSSRTGSDGTAKILIYAPYGSDERIDDEVIFLYETDICYEYYPDSAEYPNPYPAVILNATDPDNPLFIVNIPFLFAGGTPVTQRYLKGGGAYTFGVVYEDRANRSIGVVKGPSIELPFHVDGLTRYQVKWSIHSEPPTWATHYRIVRTRNALHQTYVQWTAQEVLYVRIPSQNEAPILTTYAAGDYTHLLFRLYLPKTDNISGPELLLFWQLDGQAGYVPVRDDRVRLILDSNGAPMATTARILEAQIEGLYTDADKIYAVVPAVFGNIEIKGGTLCEYMTPRANEEDVWYEGGNDCYVILEDVGRRHAGGIQDQVLLGPDILPAAGIYTGGDTYWRRQKYTATGIYLTEHQTPNRILTEPCEDIGRPFLYLPDAAQLFFYSRIRFSGKYVPGTKVNNLGSFGALDYQEINRQWGPIFFLAYTGNVLLAICESKVQPIYVSKDVLQFLSGVQGLGRTDAVLAIADESISDYGTRNPESIVIEGGRVYGWDAYHGVVWRYAQNGVVPITTNMVRYFRELGRIFRPPAMANPLVVGGYDRRHEMLILAFWDPRNTASVTLGYDEAQGLWKTRFNWIPEMIGMVSQELFSFKGGNLWRHHDTTTAYSTWYGTGYKPTIQFVVNEFPAAVKVFYSIRLLTNQRWAAPVIQIPPNLDYATGMLSRLKALKFKRYEGVLAADFLRDMNDTSPQYLAISDTATRQATALLSGRVLRGRVLIITLEAESGAVATSLIRVDTYFVPSEETNA